MTHISKWAVLECKRVVADSIRNLRSSEDNLNNRLKKLNSKCHGTQFKNIKAILELLKNKLQAIKNN